MNICVDCLAEMVCRKTGAIAYFGGTWVKSADVYKCPECGNQTADVNETGYDSPDIAALRVTMKEWFLDMSANGKG